MVVTSVKVLRRIGGNLPDQFDAVVDTIRQRQRVEGKIAALTAQGKYQTVSIALVGLALGFGLWLICPEMMQPLIGTIPGKACLGVSMSLFVLGIISIKKLSAVRV